MLSAFVVVITTVNDDLSIYCINLIFTVYKPIFDTDINTLSRFVLIGLFRELKFSLDVNNVRKCCCIVLIRFTMDSCLRLMHRLVFHKNKEDLLVPVRQILLKIQVS